MNIAFSVNNFFDYNSNFDMFVLKVISSREDLYKINMLLSEFENDTSKLLFTFKFALGITRESYWLLYRFYNDYKKDLESLYNFNEIEVVYEEITKTNDGHEKDKCFASTFLFDIRNEIFHYTEKNEVQAILKENQYSSTIEIGETSASTRFPFVNNIFADFITKKWTTYTDDNKNNQDLNSCMKKIAEFGGSIAKIFDLIIGGFFEKKNMFK